jgi:hypothetical protein
MIKIEYHEFEATTCIMYNVAAQIIDTVDSKKLSAYDKFSLALKSKEVK